MAISCIRKLRDQCPGIAPERGCSARGQCYLPPMRPHVPPPSPTTQNTELGGGVWAEHLRWAAPESVGPLIGGGLGAGRLRARCLYRSGWARRVRPGGLIPSWRGDQQDFWGGIPSHRVGWCMQRTLLIIILTGERRYYTLNTTHA